MGTITTPTENLVPRAVTEVSSWGHLPGTQECWGPPTIRRETRRPTVTEDAGRERAQQAAAGKGAKNLQTGPK